MTAAMAQEFGSFFIPGPTEVRQEVLLAMTAPMIPHRSPEFEALFARIQTGLGAVFRTSRPVFVLPASGTGTMEAGIRCSPPGPVLALVNGAFSERFARIAELCGRSVDRYGVPPGEIHDLTALSERLHRTTYAAVTVVHSETSTGALNDIHAISEACREHGAFCLVDSVSGVGGAELRFDEWGLDYVLTGSQKALALPSGLAFAAASERFLEASAAAESPGFYFNLRELDRFARHNQVPATPAFSLMYALDAQLAAIMMEGVERRWARHATMAKATQAWLADSAGRLGFPWRNLVRPGAQSPTVSAIRLPPEVRGDEFVQKVAQQGIRVGAGYGELAPTTFRIGHMGDHTPSTLARCFAACERAAVA